MKITPDLSSLHVSGRDPGIQTNSPKIPLLTKEEVRGWLVKVM
jgi:hypothetical protein